ncbi:MAG TPA: hypothetical protein VGQ59_21260 [Cyclobacteriaceae bacterium]|jgi:hypothetical protein|nr:hypothetical protein [Cyclobacteriaceae bacterium]
MKVRIPRKQKKQLRKRLASGQISMISSVGQSGPILIEIAAGAGKGIKNSKNNVLKND